VLMFPIASKDAFAIAALLVHPVWSRIWVQQSSTQRNPGCSTSEAEHLKLLPSYESRLYWKVQRNDEDLSF
jgi:hypothetical protein